MSATAGAVGNIAAENQTGSYANHFNRFFLSDERDPTYQHTLAFIRTQGYP